MLNELDWWIASQWENIPTKHNYIHRIFKTGTPDKSGKYTSLRNFSNLKECYIVRYADDFKIFCKNYKDACNMYKAVKNWLKDRLGLDVSAEKSKIVNLKRHYSEFLGFKIKVRKKGKFKGADRYVVEAHIKDSKLQKIKDHSKYLIGLIRQTYDPKMEYKLIQMYNAYIIGVHNYYKIATHANIDIEPIAYSVKKSLYNRLKHRMTKTGVITNKYIKMQYGISKQVRFVGNNVIVPLGYVQHRVPMDKKKSVNKYTPEGRIEIHKNLECINNEVLHELMNNPCGAESIEYNDNRISMYVAQKGKCAITKKVLELNEIDCHHKLPRAYGGTDEYKNLVIISDKVHALIHANVKTTIDKYIKIIKPDKEQLEKINKLRVMAKMEELTL